MLLQCCTWPLPKVCGDVAIFAVDTGGLVVWDSYWPLKKVTFGMMYMLAQEQFFRLLLEGKGETIFFYIITYYIQLGHTICLGSYKHIITQLQVGFFRNRHYDGVRDIRYLLGLNTWERKGEEAGWGRGRNWAVVQVWQSFSQPTKELRSEYCPSRLSRVGLKWLSLCTRVLLSHWMWAVSGKDRTLARRRSVEAHLKDVLLSLKWAASHSLKKDLHGMSLVYHSPQSPWLHFQYFGGEAPRIPVGLSSLFKT